MAAQTAHARDASARDTRARLLAAARELMIEHGNLEVPIAEITLRAGVNVALVSYHFGGREGLMLEIAADDARLALAELARLQTATMTASDKIRAHVKGIIHTYYRRPYLNRLLQKLLREGSAEASRQVAEFLVRPVADARGAILREGIASGEFRAVDPDLVGYAVDGACAQIFSSAASRMAVLGDGTLDRQLVDRYTASTAELILNGLLAARSAGDR